MKKGDCLFSCHLHSVYDVTSRPTAFVCTQTDKNRIGFVPAANVPQMKKIKKGEPSQQRLSEGRRYHYSAIVISFTTYTSNESKVTSRLR